MKKTLRFYLVLLMTKCMIRLMRLLGKNATNLPGEVALYLCPTLLAQIGKPGTIIGVTGTNGKTTVCNMLADVLEDNGYVFISNRMGGNVDTGIASTLIKAATLGGKCRYDLAVLEIDERSAPRIYPHLTPSYLVCTNLFRDSAQRNAHAEFISGLLTKYIPSTTKLILNGDDLISGRLAPENERVYFGINRLDGEDGNARNIINDMAACPVCDHPLVYDFCRYNHIGRAHCSHCDVASPSVDYEVTAVDTVGNRLIIHTPNGEQTYRLVGKNITDAYNTAAAVALLSEFGLTPEQIGASYEKMKIVESRFSQVSVNSKTVIANVAKGRNPIACSRVFDFVRKTPGQKAVILIIDDVFETRSGTEDTSWAYGCDFEFLAGDDIRQIIIGGVRSWDFQMRMLMAGIPQERITCCEQESETVDHLRWDEADTFFLLHDISNESSAMRIRSRMIEICEQGGVTA